MCIVAVRVRGRPVGKTSKGNRSRIKLRDLFSFGLRGFGYAFEIVREVRRSNSIWGGIL